MRLLILNVQKKEGTNVNEKKVKKKECTESKCVCMVKRTENKE